MSEREGGFGRVWDAFLTTPTLFDGRHDTARWSSRPGPFAMCIIRIDAGQLQPAIDEVRRSAASLPDIRLHPDSFLHISLQELGFIANPPRHGDEVSSTSLEEFVTMAAPAISERAPFTLSLRGVNSFQDAMFVEAHDDEETDWLHQRLFDISSTAEDATYAYLPHMTIGHYTGQGDAEAAARLIAPLRTLDFGQITVAQIEVVTLATNESYPALTPYAVIPLLG